MKIKLLITMIWGALMVSGLPLGASDYFNPAEYQYNMTITGTVLIADIEISRQDTLFAYSGEQCRGLISPEFEAGSGKWFVYLVVHGHGTSEEIIFKYYDDTKHELIALNNSIVFEINRILGSPGSPYIFSDVALSAVKYIFSEDESAVRQTANALIIDIKENACFELFDITGKIVCSKNLKEGRTVISLDGIHRNIYILRLHDKNSFYTKRIIH